MIYDADKTYLKWMCQLIGAPFQTVDIVKRIDATRTVPITIAAVIFQFQYVGVPAIMNVNLDIIITPIHSRWFYHEQ